MISLNVTMLPDCNYTEECFFNSDPALKAEGTFKECHRGTISNSEGNCRRVAITFFKARPKQQEIDILRRFSLDPSPYLVQALGFTPASILFEECACDLRVLQLANETLVSMNIRKIVNGILEGIAYLHNRNLVHRDLKRENVLVNINSNLEAEIKLADFGDAIDAGLPEALEIVGSPQYCSPEVFFALANKNLFLPEGTNLKALDVWAAGNIFWRISLFKPLAEFLANPPEGHVLGTPISDEFAASCAVHLNSMVAYFSDQQAYNFLHMLDLEPSTRPTVNQVLAEFLQN